MSTAIEAPDAPELTTPRRGLGIERRQLIGAGIGQVIEWFDWTAYALLAVYFAPQFFPADTSGLVALLGTYGILAVGFIARPLAGLVVGAVADHFGRKRALMLTVYGMGGASLVIALAPTYEQVGALAPLILLLARIVQGICIGGEFASVSALAMESAGPGHRGWVAGLMNLFGNLGGVLLVGIVTGLAFLIGDDAMAAGGWRIVFLLGALLALGGWFLRRHMAETQAPEAADHRVTLRSLVHPMLRRPRQSIQVIGLTLGFTAMVYAWGTYFPAYASTYRGLALQWSMLSLLVTHLSLMVLMPLAGLVSDRFGRRPTMVAGGLALTLGTVPALGLLTDSVARLLVIQLVGNAFIALLQASSMPAYAELFPRRFRATGFGFPYSLTVGLIGGTVPLVGTELKNLGAPDAFPWYLVALMGISTLFYLRMRETAFDPLPE